MKQITIQIRFDAERYAALLRYAARREISVEQELLDCAERLYKKHVPPDVREYIEGRGEPSGRKAAAKNKERACEFRVQQPQSENLFEQDSEENTAENASAGEQ